MAAVCCKLKLYSIFQSYDNYNYNHIQIKADIEEKSSVNIKQRIWSKSLQLPGWGRSHGSLCPAPACRPPTPAGHDRDLQCCTGSTWIYLDLPGSAWICLDLPGSTWIYLDLPGSTWICLDLPGSTWICLDLPGSTWSVVSYLNPLIYQNAQRDIRRRIIY